MRRAVSKLLPRLGRSESLYHIDQAAVEDFYIMLDHPHKSWLPGDEILGQVILILRRNLANIAIVFSLAGYVRINALHHLKLRPVKHVLFNHNIKIYGPDTPVGDDFANGLYKGEHRFPFIVKLPNKRVYTLLDFGKGAIEYVLKALLRSADTLPVLPGDSLSPGPELFGKGGVLLKLHSPTFTLEKTIQLVNPIDVAELPPPKPKRLIIKDPRTRLARVQLSALTINTFSTLLSNNLDSESIATASATHTPSLAAHASPGTVTSATCDKPSHSNIRVSMELGLRGFLRGELIPIKLNISHLKKIQDLGGIIATLVRVCRIDYGPDGLYELFRKDLLQLVVPLFVDPTTLLLEINTSLRVPPDAFPTILGCPMVLFQYFVEVMLNLLGKPVNVEERPQDDPAYTYSPRPTFINTDKFKRLKKFLQITSEVVIGTNRLDRNDASLGRRLLLGLALNPTSPFPPRSAINMIPESATIDDFSIPPYLGQDNAAATLESTTLGAATPPLGANGTSVTTLGPTIGNINPPIDTPRGTSMGTPVGTGTGIPGAPGTLGTTGTDTSVGPTLGLGIRGEGPSIPTYEAVGVTAHLHQNLSEKDRMRMHEASLLPSEPQFDVSDPDDTVSPMDPSTDILDDLISQGAQSDDFHRDGLYEAPDIHEGIGLEGAKDYVPNYDSSGNDRLVITGDQHSERME